MKMRMLLKGLLLLVVFLSFQPAPRTSSLPGYSLHWADEFNGNALNRTKWNYRGLGQRGDAINDSSSIFLNGKGQLCIEVRRTGGKLMAGIIDTERLFETRFGYFECRAKLPHVYGVWPAFWLQSSRNQDFGQPSTHGAEIDIFEYFHNNRKDTVSHTLHYGGYGSTHKVAGPVLGALSKTVDDFHVFGLEWTPDAYKTFVDGVMTYSGNTFISQVPEFIVLSMEVDSKVAGPLNERQLPASFVVDYVRVYKKL
jgi:beta-glucanase (GH16 family)